MTTRVLFTHSFSTTPHLIQALRDNPDRHPFEIFCTHHNPRSLQLHVADHAEVEPPLEGDAHAEYCLDLCRRHGIQVLVPGYRTIGWIAPHRAAFEAAGTRVVLAASADLIAILEDKAHTFGHLAGRELVTLPAHRFATDLDGFRTAHDALVAEGHQICFKPVRAYGASGFRIIQEDLDPLRLFTQPPGVRIPLATVLATLGDAGAFPELMVMEYLPGAEYSLDCLALGGELQVAIPRRKLDGRLRLLEDRPDLVELARRVTAALELSAAFNIQIRHGRDGVPKLLEINARMSAGLYISNFSGVNVPYLALRQSLGLPYTVPEPGLGRLVAEMEQAFLLDGVAVHQP